MSNYSDSLFDLSSENSSWYKVYHLIREGTSVLDVGCSSGNFGSELVKRKNCYVDGIELDAADAKIAEAKLSNVWVLNVETDDLSALPQKKYDYIYFGDVIEHLVDPINTLKRISGLLNEKGKIIFSIPNMGHVGVRLALLEGRFQYAETGLLDKTHLHYYTLEEVYRVFESAGYAINTMSFVQKDYPNELIEKHLNSLGLKGSKFFYKLMHHSEASAFQFIGTADKHNVVIHKIPHFSPIDLFETFHEDTKKGYENRIKNMESVIQVLSTERDNAQKLLALKHDHPYRALAGHLTAKIKEPKKP